MLICSDGEGTRSQKLPTCQERGKPNPLANCMKSLRVLFQRCKKKGKVHKQKRDHRQTMDTPTLLSKVEKNTTRLPAPHSISQATQRLLPQIKDPSPHLRPHTCLPSIKITLEYTQRQNRDPTPITPLQHDRMKPQQHSTRRPRTPEPPRV